jgi:hypothetical protein
MIVYYRVGKYIYRYMYVTMGDSPIHVSIYILTYSIIHNHSCPENPHLTLPLLYVESIIVESII